MIRRWAHADADYTTLAPRLLIAADPKSQDSQPWRQQPPPTHTTKGPTARSTRPEITARERNPAPHESSPSTARAHARCSSARAIAHERVAHLDLTNCVNTFDPILRGFTAPIPLVCP